MYEFEYHRPKSLADAAKAFASAADGVYIAGGQTVIPTMKHRLAAPSDLIDLSGIADLKGISANGGAVEIGALSTHNEVAESAAVAKAIPALAELASHIGDPQVRNRGTIGGALANNDPSADYPAAVVALNATVHTDKSTIGADEFFTGMFETALGEGDLITKVSFPIPEKAAYKKFPNPASRYATVGVMVVVVAGGGVRVAVTGAGPSVFRASEFESALAGGLDPSRLDGLSVSADGLNSDIHASAEYRAHLIGVMAKRAVAEIA
jgi:carbon-monoxide dehydrogenase medium subunit